MDKNRKEEEEEQKEYHYVPEHVWTAQMIGKDFFYHHDTIHVLYDVNPMERIDFTLSDTF